MIRNIFSLLAQLAERVTVRPPGFAARVLHAIIRSAVRARQRELIFCPWRRWRRLETRRTAVQGTGPTLGQLFCHFPRPPWGLEASPITVCGPPRALLAQRFALGLLSRKVAPGLATRAPRSGPPRLLSGRPSTTSPNSKPSAPAWLSSRAPSSPAGGRGATDPTAAAARAPEQARPDLHTSSLSHPINSTRGQLRETPAAARRAAGGGPPLRARMRARSAQQTARAPCRVPPTGSLIAHEK